MVERSPPNQKVQGLSPARSIVLVRYGCTIHVVVPRRSDGTLNQGLVCVRMHLRSCADLKEPGWPSESLGVRKQADNTDRHTVLRSRSWADCNKWVQWGKQMTGPHATPPQKKWGTQQQQPFYFFLWYLWECVLAVTNYFPQWCWDLHSLFLISLTD